jgi:hypothetical protein
MRMSRQLFPESPAYLRQLSAAGRERARALFVFLNALILISTAFILALNLLLKPLPTVNALIVSAIASSFLCLWVLHNGRPQLAGNIINGGKCQRSCRLEGGTTNETGKRKEALDS